MTRRIEQERVDELRRRLIKSSALVGGALAASRLPYSSPRVQSFLGSSAYAQTTVFTIIDCVSTPTETGPGGGICDDAQLIDIMATVSPIPPIGTELRCVAVTDDPDNPSIPDGIDQTDASGMVTFFMIDLQTFPIAPIAAGSILTLTVSFVDSATFGLATCVQTYTVEACA